MAPQDNVEEVAPTPEATLILFREPGDGIGRDSLRRTEGSNPSIERSLSVDEGVVQVAEK